MPALYAVHSHDRTPVRATPTLWQRLRRFGIAVADGVAEGRRLQAEATAKRGYPMPYE